MTFKDRIQSIADDFDMEDDVIMKYVDKYGFAKCFMMRRYLKTKVFFPLFVYPSLDDKDELPELYLFKQMLRNVGLDKYYDLDNLTLSDIDSISAVIRCADDECFELSGKKKQHEDRSTIYFEKMMKQRIESSIEPVYQKMLEDGRDSKIFCFYESSEKAFVAISEDSQDFDKVKDLFQRYREKYLNEAVKLNCP